jgi:predicted ATP-grasp superfamily ATP-dependent carboligase
MKERVLVLDIGDAPYALTVARSLGSSGYCVDYGIPLGKGPMELFSKFCHRFLVYPDPSYAKVDFQVFLYERSRIYDYIIPTMEKTMLAAAEIKEKIESMGPKVLCPDYEALKLAVQKSSMLALARKVGLPVPKTIVTSEAPSFESIIDALGLPFIMKCSTEVDIQPGERKFLIEEYDERKFSLCFKKLSRWGPVIIQEYIRGKGIGIELLYSMKGELIAFHGHERILEQYLDGGPSIMARTSINKSALQYAISLLNVLKWKGAAMVEFKLGNDGKLYFMELNPRFWGTTLLAIASGVNFPLLLVKSCKEETNRLIGPDRTASFFSFESLLSGFTSNNRPSLRSLISGFFKLSWPISIRETYCDDIVPELKKFLLYLRRHLVEPKIGFYDGLYFGPPMPVSILKKFNISKVIDLRQDDEIKAYFDPCAQIEHIRFPIKEDSYLSPDSFVKLLNLIEREKLTSNIYIHCKKGRGRTAMVILGYMVMKGVDLQTAYLQLLSLYPHMNLTREQRAALYDLRKYLLNKVK